MKRCLLLLSIVLLTSLSAQDYGLTTRVSNTSLLISTTGEAAEIELKPVFTELGFSKALFLTHAGDGTNRIFIVQNKGKIDVFANDENTENKVTFLDITGKVNSGGEKGLLGLAFHPDYENNGLFYVCYTAGNLNSVVAEYKVSSDPNLADPQSERVLMAVPQPDTNHNGGMIAFGQDGYLYIGFGDGGGSGDPYKNGQDPKTLLGSMLRIDVDNKQGNLEYAIPADNPFVGNSNGYKEEVWAYGLRNPWRWSFDRANGMLWAGDVGQNAWEEVDIIEKGKNYGWNVMEGTHCYKPSSGCNQSGLTLPVAEYDHSQGYSITGGYVYRGSEMPNFSGTYFYGDYGTRRIWGLKYVNGTVESNTYLGESPASISSFGEDENGELYVVGYSGQIYKITEKSSSGTGSVPSKISESGMYSDLANKVIAPGLIEFDVNAPLWSDNIKKERFLALPDTSQIGFNMDGEWDYPNETVLVKNFRVEMTEGDPNSEKLIETRFMVKHSDGSGWSGYSYRWDENESDAVLLADSDTRPLTITGSNGPYNYDYYFPSRVECIKCHTPASGFALGPKTAQANRDFEYENNVTDNQLRSFNNIELFTTDIGEDYSNFPQLAVPSDKNAELDKRVSAYFDANCAHCHMPGGTGVADIDLRYVTALESANIIDVDPTQGTLGISGAKRIKSGEPDKSVLLERMKTLQEHRMPPLASSVADTMAINLLTKWIVDLSATSLKKDPHHMAESFHISAYPNPFNPQTKIRYYLPQNGVVTIKIYDINGRVVDTINKQLQQAGSHTITWNAQQANVSSGIYFYEVRLLSQTQLFRKTEKLVLIK